MSDKLVPNDGEEDENRENELSFIEDNLISFIKDYKIIYDENEKSENVERAQLIKDTYDYIAHKLTELMNGSYVFLGKYFKEIYYVNYLIHKKRMFKVHMWNNSGKVL